MVRSTFFFEKAQMTKEHAILEERLKELAAPAIEARGLVLWGLEIAAEGSAKIVRIFIDVPESSDQKGVTVDQCAEVSRQAGLQFEVEDAVPGRYILEVSSPGIERRFFSLEQLVPHIGQELDLRTYEARDGRKHYKGVLKDVRCDKRVLTLTADPGPKAFDIEFGWDEIKKVKRIHRFHDAGGENGDTR